MSPAIIPAKALCASHATTGIQNLLDDTFTHRLNHTHIGIVKNARWRANTLRADAWIETSKAPGDLLTLLKMGQRVEVSTGLETVVRDKLLLSFTPDHLAILTDEIGACSIDKGCGLLANNSEAPCKCRKHKERPLLPSRPF